MLVVMAGLPGTGKTTLARELAVRTSGRVVSKDEVRHAIFLNEEIEYSSQQDDFCMEIMLQLSGYILRREPARFVFLDGRTFSRRYQIENVVTAAASLSQPWRIVECVCSEESAKMRIEKDISTGGHAAQNRNYELYLKVKASFEAITFPKTVLDTDQPLESCCARALAVLT